MTIRIMAGASGISSDEVICMGKNLGRDVKKLLISVPTGDEEAEYTDEFRRSILRGRMDILQGRTISLAEMKKRLGL